jgi:murein DD-endopeptidase MepM/ murein hydrolase activator NlpD
MATWNRSLIGSARLGVCVLLVLSLLSVPAVRAGAAADRDSSIDAVVDDDEAVRRARDELLGAERQRDALNQRLDEAAAEFENARGLAERLTSEAGQADEALRSVEASSQTERQATADRMIAAYLAPSRQLSMSEFVFAADDAATAMHVVGLIEQMGHRSDRAITRINEAEHLTRDEVRQQHVVTAGAQGAAQERLRAAGRLQAVLDDAVRVVATADATVARAEEDAAERERRRAEAERRRQEAERRAREEAERRAREGTRRAAREDRPGDSAPPPAVDGRVCPIGTPNGFIDSWGFPRSGGRTHKGVDIFAAYGTPLFAVADGVANTGSNRLGGLTINLTDDQGHRYYYAHLASIAVADEARVRAGEVIGATGTSGNAAGTPPHVHWQYHPGGGAAVNPYPLSVALCR